MDFKVKNLNFSESFKPVVIAEMSGNHNGSIKIAKKIIKKAAESGVDMIKFQTYTPETMTLKSNKAKFTIKDRKSLWKNNNLLEDRHAKLFLGTDKEDFKTEQRDW